jgi:carbon-monoxide dehydrogenase medium subunit
MNEITLHQPETVEQVLALLAAEPEARALAGGQTLVAMLNAGLLDVPALISLRRVGTLKQFEAKPDGSVIIGAMLSHATLAREARLSGGHAVLRAAAGAIAHPAIRNFGTIGGAICHADPSADYPAVLVALDAAIAVVGAKGKRLIPAEDFFEGFLTTALEPGELAVAIHLPPPLKGACSHYEKLARVDGDFAVASLALVLLHDDARCTKIRVAVGGCGPRPVRDEAAERRLQGSHLEASAVAEAGALLAAACDPLDDVRASAAYRRRVVPVLLKRAIAAARSTVVR